MLYWQHSKYICNLIYYFFVAKTIKILFLTFLFPHFLPFLKWITSASFQPGLALAFREWTSRWKTPSRLCTLQMQMNKTEKKSFACEDKAKIIITGFKQHQLLKNIYLLAFLFVYLFLYFPKGESRGTPFCHFSYQMPSAAKRLQPEPGTPPSSPHGGGRSSGLSHHLCPQVHVSRKPDGEWRQDLDPATRTRDMDVSRGSLPINAYPYPCSH